MRDPRITDTFSNGAVLLGDELRAVGESGLTGRELSNLPRPSLRGGRGAAARGGGAAFPRAPDPGGDPLHAAAARRASEPPRILLDVQREGDALTVLPTLVYGQPPTARVDGGRLVHLGGPLPLRDEAAEARPGASARRRARARARASQHAARRRGRGVRETSRALPRRAARAGTRSLLRGAAAAGRASASRTTASTCASNPPATTERRGAPTPRRSCAHGAPASRWWLSARRALRRFRPTGWRATERASPSCWRRAMPRAAFPAPRSRIWRGSAMCSASRGRRSSRAFVRWSTASRASRPPRCRRTSRPRCATTSAGESTGSASSATPDSAAFSPTTWASARRSQALCAIRGRTLVVAPTSAPRLAKADLAIPPGAAHGAPSRPERSLDPEPTSPSPPTGSCVSTPSARGHPWDTVVVDEAQNVKNPDSQLARAARGLDADFRIALTGTPVENRLDELWSELHLRTPACWGHARTSRPRRPPDRRRRAGAVERLRERIRPFVLRRTKREVAPELPPRTDVVLYCQLDEEERAVYDAVRAASLAEVQQRLASGGGVMAALEALLRLRQAACHASLVPGQARVALLEARAAARDAGRGLRRRAQGPRLLPVDEPPRPGGARALRSRVSATSGSTDRRAIAPRWCRASRPPTGLPCC